jgi:FixJ family two-component response regulator
MPDPERLRVLVVDDEEEILELLGEYLKARGHEVRTAYDGRDAIDLIRQGALDLVITDLKMPGMGGIELQTEIARLNQPVATILMTGFGTVETAVQAMQAGAYDYLLKPFKLRSVHDAMLRAWERLRREREQARRAELVQFYEVATSLDDPAGLPRLFGLLAAVARRETAADEVALWMRGPSGWEAVARGGTVRRLATFDVEGISSPIDLPEGGAAAPILVGYARAGVIAVAGGERRANRLERLLLLSRVLGQNLARLGWQPRLSEGRGSA